MAVGLSLVMAQPCQATSPVVQTQTKLKQLDAQIKNLQQTLTTANDKRGILHKELSGTEKQIGEGIRKLYGIQQDINAKEHKIAELHNKSAQLNKQLLMQQQLLASHVRARYQMGEYQPVKWILNQDDPYKISRILTYYQYIVKSRQDLINEIGETRQSLSENKERLHSELTETQKLKHQLTQHQELLQHNKSYHTTLIQSLNKEIQNKQHTLTEFQKDKDNLSRLLKSLSQQSVVQSSKPFLQMRKKLPLPVQTEHRSIRRMNQGVTFFADEGAVVTAVYPGKVVFSDWLKGYGLLVIIDHGQGFMTLYAHNQSLFKHKGQTVRQNEQIASVGHSGGIKQNGLYFEIRQRGKAVSPLNWLS
ncbi:murein hydrolase activator EnvC family protein [Legionella shakespearei]|nr:peptidoglycan DD-metalloendopeptidase family protein [Legionella shakespearei]